MRAAQLRQLALLSTLAVAGCYREGLEIYDLTGTVVLPREAGVREITRRVARVDGNGDPVLDGQGKPIFDDVSETVEDARLIGPVYLGLYAEVAIEAESYPAPSGQFPYPYMGTTIGDLRFACVESLKCKVASGRFVDFDSYVDWFNNTVGDPVTDASGQVIDNGGYLYDICRDLLAVTDPAEIRITATEDRNEDGEIDQRDLDFVQNADGDWEAQFKMWQADFTQGVKLWGFMDAPDPSSYKFSTCDAENGYNLVEYNQDFRTGVQHRDTLNEPTKYIDSDDWVTTQAFEWTDPESPATLVIDLPTVPPSSTGGAP